MTACRNSEAIHVFVGRDRTGGFAQLRFSGEYMKVRSVANLCTNKICVATAREFSAFWDIARQVRPAIVCQSAALGIHKQEGRASSPLHHHRTDNTRVTRCARARRVESSCRWPRTSDRAHGNSRTTCCAKKDLPR